MKNNVRLRRHSSLTSSAWRSLLLFCLLVSFATCGPPPATHNAARRIITGPKGRPTVNGWLRSIPALNVQRSIEATAEVSTRVKKQLRSVVEWSSGPLSEAGTYYGLTNKVVDSATSPAAHPGHKRTPRMRETLTETLEEVRRMREEMEALRKELADMRRQQLGEELPAPVVKEDSPAARRRRKQRQRELENLGAEIEQWAKRMLAEDEDWTEVSANKMFPFNKDGRTRAYLRWMKDSRDSLADAEDTREYPCIKCFSTIDAPLEEVCLFLADEEHMEDYNDLIEDHKDEVELSPSAKICSGATPQILFIKPRQLFTYCSHRWLADGTQVIVNQAYDLDDDDEDAKKKPTNPKAYALRGANFIARDPDDPEKTRISILCHASPGPDVPQWAMKTAVKSLAPIEPFKLFYRINNCVLQCRDELSARCRSLSETELVSANGRSKRPAGIAQMGYACFWPNGGGLDEGWRNQKLASSDEERPLQTSDEAESRQGNAAVVVPKEAVAAE